MGLGPARCHRIRPRSLCETATPATRQTWPPDLGEAAARGVTDDGADLSLLGEPEMRFLRKALELPEVIADSVEFFEPHRIAFYALELANVFHPIFDSVRVLGVDVPPELAAARLRFFKAAQAVFRRSLRLMGMTTPDVM